MEKKVALLLLCFSWSVFGSDVVVSTPFGMVKGTAYPNHSEFLGIPYAEPPIGNLRWRRPLSITPWHGVLDAQSFKSNCLQTDPAFNPMDEDCLFLNVFTPTPVPQQPIPVMVYIHGGGFETGGSNFPEYTGAYIVNKYPGVVVATINYRLGVFGFLASAALKKEDAHNSTGNYGLQDQQLALQWIKKSIIAFGGDPNQITIFGESAGGASVAEHLLMPSSAGLFERAIMESGPITRWGYKFISEAYPQFSQVEQNFNCNSMDCLRKVDAMALNKFHPSACNGIQDLCWAPVVDYSQFPASPPELAAAGNFSGVYDVIIGTNLNEGTVFAGPYKSMNATQYAQLLKANFGSASTQLLALYPASAYPAPWQAFSDLYTDCYFLCTSRRTARWLLAGSSRVYRYWYTHVLYDITMNPDWSWLGSFHSSEIPVVFQNPNGIYHPLEFITAVNFTSAEVTLQDVMGTYWTSFAITGTPFGEGMVKWPQYVSDNEAYIVLDEVVSTGKDLRKRYCDFWDTMPY